MTIQTIPRRLPEVGRLRLGERQLTRNGQTRPAALAAWRLTSKSRFRLDAAAKVYGGQVREWKDAPGEDDQYELYTEAKALRVAVVSSYDNDGRTIVPYSQFYETWSAGGIQRRCDGRTELRSGEPCLCATECDIPSEYSCDPLTRFSVLLPDLPGLGSWMCETHGYYAAMELPGSIDLLLSIGRPVPVALVIDQRTVKRPGEPPKHFVVPMLDSRQSFMDLQMLAAADPVTGELETANPGTHPPERSGLALTSGGAVPRTDEASGQPGRSSGAPSDTPPGEEQRVPAPPTEAVRDQSVAVPSSPGPTSPPPVDPGKVAGGGDPTSGSEGTGLEPPAAPAGGGTAADPDTIGAGSTDGDAGGSSQPGTDPAPDQSLAMTWCGERGVNPRHARLHLAKAHKDEFGDLKDWKDLAELEGDRDTKAVVLLDIWWHEQQEENFRPQGG